MIQSDPVVEVAAVNGRMAKHEIATLKCALVREFFLRALKEAKLHGVTPVIQTGGSGTTAITEGKLFCLHDDKI